MHPLLGDLRDVSDEEIDEKINQIYERLKTAGNNPYVYNQLMMVLSSYQEEKQRRNREQLKKIDDDKKYSDKIDIGK
jgi:DNA-binding ferritin-like protein